MSTLTRKKILQIVKAAQGKGKKPDFSGADLSQTDLSGAYLMGAYFIGTDLSQANLNQANLSGAHLSQTHLSGAHLRGAKLGEAYLSKAHLDRANLCGAHLSGAYLIGADLSQANLSGAHLNQANLSGADLSGACLNGANLNQTALIWADLSQADLSQADLSEASLCEADLSQTNLCEVDFSQADLFRANLGGADLSQANLIWADLSQANLSGANLSQANLSRGKLVEANFSQAVLGLTSFGDIDLSMVKGFDSVEHRGPSTIGMDTLSRSRGQIPDIFLRGCGLSDVQIETARLNNPDLTLEQIATITRRIQELRLEQSNHSCFISYTAQDEAFARQLHDDLQQKGIRCWFAPQNMRMDDDKIKPIDYSIRHQDKLLLILSASSIDNNEVAKEVENALKEEDRRGETVLWPVLLDETVMQTDQAWAVDIGRTRHIGDFSQWPDRKAYQKSFNRLLADLMMEDGQG
jgi:uncharacterized protein YjbI with pentapeptide repeats